MDKEKTELPIPTHYYDHRFCDKCGSKIVLSREPSGEHSGNSGKPTYNILGRCPKYSMFRRGHFNEVMSCGVSEEDAKRFCEGA